MKKSLRIVRNILIVLLGVFLITLIMKWGPLDDFLTSKIGSTVQPKEQSDTLIRISGYRELLPDGQKPYAVCEDGRMYLLADGKKIDVTPPGIPAVFYSDQNEINGKLRYRDHACFDAETNRLLFIVDVQDVPVLFLADLNSGEVVKVAENIDSFLFIDGDAVYAQGYQGFNYLKIYSGGETRTIAGNCTSVPVPECGGILINSDDRSLMYYDTVTGRAVQLSDSSDSICVYCVFGNALENLIAYCETDGGYQSVFFNRSTGRSTRYVIDRVPEKCWSCGPVAYTFDPVSGQICSVNADAEKTVLFGSAGHIYKVFGAEAGRSAADTEGDFCEFFATADGIYFGQAGPDGTEKALHLLCRFTGSLKRYSSHPWLIRYHMEAGGGSVAGFYIAALSEESNIINSSNPGSWMNRFSSYVYKLLFFDYYNGLRECDVPVSREARLPESLTGDGNAAVYASRFEGGQIKALSTLRNGEVLSRDLLKTAGSAKGSFEVFKDIADGSLYVTVVNGPSGADGYVFSGVVDGDYRSMRSGDDDTAVSFGRAYQISRMN